MTVLEFLRSIPSSFSMSFWPKSYSHALIMSFYNEFLSYVVIGTELYPDFSTDVAGFMGGIVFAALDDVGADLAISRAFLSALAKSFPQIIPLDGNKLVTRLLDSFLGLSDTGASSSGGNSIDGFGSPTGRESKGVSYFLEESVEYLEKQEIAFKLIERVLDKVQVDTKLLERIRLITKEQLRLMTSFLK
nr:phosphatidylinositol 4-kinase alpha 1 [Tanacetum cinerariifolium]